MEKKIESDFVLAAHKGNVEELKRLYETFPAYQSYEKKEQSYFALYFAAFYKHEDIVTFLLSKNVDPNFALVNYLTPLHAAAFKGSEEIVKMLLDHKADVNPKRKVKYGKKKVKDNYFCSPLHAAVYGKHAGAVSLLLEAGALVNVKLFPNVGEDSNIPNLFSLKYGTFSRYYFGEGFESWLGYSPLHSAILSSNIDIVKLLLKYGADVNAKCNRNTTPLCIACKEDCNYPLIQLILKAGADITTEVSNKNTLLHYILKNYVQNAAEEYYEGYYKKDEIRRNKVFRLLLKVGADPNSWSGQEGNSVLHYAVKNVMPNVVHLLLKYAADVNALDDEKKTPFENAVTELQSVLEEIQDEYFYVPDSDSEDEDSRRFSESSDEEDYRRELKEREEKREQKRQRLLKKRKIYDLSQNKYVYNVWQYRKDKKRWEGFTVDNDPDVLRSVCQLLTQELVRLEEMEKTIVEQNVTLLQTDFVKPYYTKCKDELKKMKNIAIVEGVSYYDFLFADDEKLKEYMENNEITKTLSDRKNCRKLFPNFSRSLRLKMKPTLQRKSENQDEESNGSSDEELGKGSVQIKSENKRRKDEFCVIS